jgi:hypothetical protein
MDESTRIILRAGVMQTTNAPSDIGKLDGMRVQLARKKDRCSVMCRASYATVRIIKGCARYRCASCGNDRGEVQKEIATWLLTVMAFWPETQQKTFLVR